MNDLRTFFHVAWVDYNAGQISDFNAYSSVSDNNMRVVAVNGRDDTATGSGILVDVLSSRENNLFLIEGIGIGGSMTTQYRTTISKVKMTDENYEIFSNFLGFSYS